MRDIGGLVWIVFVLFAVISSIVRSARRASQQRAPVRQPAAPQSPPPPAPRSPQTVRRVSAVKVNVRTPQGMQLTPELATLIDQFKRDAQAHVTPVPTAQPAPPVVPIVAAPAAIPPPVIAPAAPSEAARVPRLAGLFPDRRALVRGIVAAEVLGKPLALRDE